MTGTTGAYLAERPIRPIDKFDDAEALVHRFEQRAIPSLAFAQGFFDTLAVGSVNRTSDEAVFDV